MSAVENVGTPGRKLQYNKSTPRFACYTSVQTPLKFYKEGSPEFSVEVEPSGEFRQDTGDWVLTEGTSGAILTAVAKNGEGDVSYAWSGAFEGANEILPIPDGLTVDDVPEGYTVTVTATDSSEPPQTATAEFSFTLVPAPQAYMVTIDDGIENGTVQLFDGETELASGEAVYEGTTVKVVATPTDRSFKVEAVGVAATDDPSSTVPLENGEFTMPGFNVTVTAAFAPWEGTAYALVESMDDFEAGADYLVVAGTDAMKNEPDGDRIAVSGVEITGGVVETEDESIVWTVDNGSEGKYTFYNAAANVYVSAPSYESTGAASLVEDGTAAEAQWTLSIAEDSLATIGSVYDGISLQRNSSHPYFAAYKGGTKPSLYKKVGAGVFSITLDPAEDFEVPEGTEATITATAKNAQGEVTYDWNATEGGTPGSAEGNVWTIPADAPVGGPWTLYCTANDGTSEADASVSFSITNAPMVYEVTVDEGIIGGEVAVDKALAEAGETVTVTATPAAGYELVAVTVDGEPIEGDTFEMPAQDVVVSATFAEVVDYATLPFVDKDTPYPGPWKNPEVAGLTNEGLGSDYRDGSAKFDGTGAWMQIKFQGTPGTLSFGIKGNGTTATGVSTFAVLESADGETWTDVAVFASDDNLTTSRQDVSFTLSEDSRYVQFLYREKGDGNVGIYDVYIGEAGDAEPAVTVTGETTLALGGTFALELALENYSGTCTWAWAPETVGYVDPDTATFWWTPTKAGETEVTFSAMDGDRTVASETVTLTVLGAPALVFGGDGEGTVGTAVNFTVVAENVADPAVTFLGFLDVPEGSALTDADVALDFPNVSFTPDVAGEYGLAFSAGTAGVDYVEDLWPVTVAEEPPPVAEPEITKVEIDAAAGEVTLEFTGAGAAVWGTDDLTDADSWAPLEVVVEGNKAKVEVEKARFFLRVQ